jgi:RNA polymerase sigma-70 factor (ECF subfamily)
MHDNDILEMYFTRDESAIKATADKFGSYCTKIAMNILGSREDCDECVNDVYLAAWNAIPPERPAVFGGFLAKITRNLAFDRYRKKNAQKRAGDSFAVVLSELDECLPSASNVEAEYERGQVAQVINRFLSSIEKQSSEIFARRYWRGDSVAEIAERYGMSYSKASSLLHRLRGKLREELEKEGISI